MRFILIVALAAYAAAMAGVMAMPALIVPDSIAEITGPEDLEGPAGEASYSLDIPAGGRYRFWLRANPKESRKTYRIDGGDWHDVDMSDPVDLINVARDGRWDHRFLAWLDQGALELDEGRLRIDFRFEGGAANSGIIDCFVMTRDTAFVPRGATRPVEHVGGFWNDELRGWVIDQNYAGPPAPGMIGDVTVIVVGGGGGGGGTSSTNQSGGGGGGGGVIVQQNVTLGAGDVLSVEIGAGGEGALRARESGSDGGTSIFHIKDGLELIAYGGSGGGGDGMDGGSSGASAGGGGGRASGGAGGAQGHDGGRGGSVHPTLPQTGGGGGGGAAGPGADADEAERTGGAGGPGRDLTDYLGTDYGYDGHFAGGGGGGTRGNRAGPAHHGGGGATNSDGNPARHGSGSGGGGAGGGGFAGGRGGGGIVFVLPQSDKDVSEADTTAEAGGREFVWVEGQDADSAEVNRHNWYDRLAGNLFSGGGWISHYDDEPALKCLERLELTGPRNGYASGQVLLTRPWPPGTEVAISDLEGAGQVIGAENARIGFAHRRRQRFPVRSGGAGDPFRLAETFTNYPYYDLLMEEPQEDSPLTPIWVTVHIPAGIAPGAYDGILTVGEQTVPVRLEAGRWVLPDPREYEMHVGMKQSPETLALTWDVEMWSDEHFELIAKSFAYMAALGSRDLSITAIAETHLGNEQSMIRYRRGEDGLEPDFSIMERYIDLYVEAGGDPRYLIVHVWHPSADNMQRRQGGLPVTVLEEDGSLRTERVPAAGHPGSEEFWRPVLEGIRERVEERGWEAKRILIALAGDGRPSMRTIEVFEELAPYAFWSVWSHFRGGPPPRGDGYELSGMRVGHHHHPYCPGGDISQEGVLGGWGFDLPVVTMPRKYLYQYSPLSQYRSFADGILAGRRPGSRAGSGFARLLTDYWEVGELRTLFNQRQFDTHNWRNMYRQGPIYMLGPGPDGPVRTVRYEMLREGIQEAEARIRIEQALAGGELDPELAGRCTDLLTERYRARMRDGDFSPSHAAHQNPYESRIWGMAPNWRELSVRLFNLAGEVEGH